MLRVLVIVTCLACGDPPAPKVALQPTEQARPGQQTKLLPMTEAQQTRWRKQLLASVDPKTIPRYQARDVIVVERSKNPVMSPARWDALAFDEEPQPGAKGKKVHVFNQLFHTRPRAQLDRSGLVTVTFKTVYPVPSASLYFGVTLGGVQQSFPRHRKRVVAQLPAKGPYQVKFPLTKLLGAKYDIAKHSSLGAGQVDWRLEVLDPREGTSRVYDDAVAFVCSPKPCDKDANFARAPAVVQGPFVDLVTTDSAVISWETDLPSASQVIYGANKQYRASTPSIGRRHEVTVSGLAADTRYRYYIGSVDHHAATSFHLGASFRTARQGDRTFSFVVLSDARSGHGAADERYGGTNRRVLRALLGRAFESSPRFVVFVGDLIDGYTTSVGAYRYELDMFKKSVAFVAGSVPLYEAFGNHETVFDAWSTGWTIGKSGKDAGEAIFAEKFVNPTNGPATAAGAPPFKENVYSFAYGNAHVAVVNSNYWYRSHAHRDDHPAAGKGSREGMVPPEVLEWLDKDLASARKRGIEHLFVMTHEPAFPNGGHTQDSMWWDGKVPAVLAMRKRFVGILAKHKVAALFHGDEHNYSRTAVTSTIEPAATHNFWQFISGGAGAPYYAQRKVPWSGAVKRFDPSQHFIEVTINGARISYKAVAIDGTIIDRVTGPPK